MKKTKNFSFLFAMAALLPVWFAACNNAKPGSSLSSASSKVSSVSSKTAATSMVSTAASVNTTSGASSIGKTEAKGGSAKVQQGTNNHGNTTSNKRTYTSDGRSRNNPSTETQTAPASPKSPTNPTPKPVTPPAPVVKAYDMAAVKNRLIAYGESRGLHYDSSVTPNNGGHSGVTHVSEDYRDEEDMIQSEEGIIDYMIRNRRYAGANFNPYIVKESSEINDYWIYELFR